MFAALSFFFSNLLSCVHKKNDLVHPVYWLFIGLLYLDNDILDF